MFLNGLCLVYGETWRNLGFVCDLVPDRISIQLAPFYTRRCYAYILGGYWRIDLGDHWWFLEQFLHHVGSKAAGLGTLVLFL